MYSLITAFLDKGDDVMFDRPKRRTAAIAVQCLSRVQNRISAPIAVKSEKLSGWNT